MYSLFATTVLFALAAVLVRADITVDTVGFTQCQPATLSWSSTTGPYNVIIAPSSDPCGEPLVDLGDLTSNTFQWSKVNITAGTQVMISVLDDTDVEGWSGVITVQSSNDNSCLNIPGTSHSSSKPSAPAPTLVGAANAGMVSNGASMLRFSGAAVAFTALGALVALL